jgi:hypothetical protein
VVALVISERDVSVGRDQNAGYAHGCVVSTTSDTEFPRSGDMQHGGRSVSLDIT